MIEANQRKRGKGKKAALFMTSIRLSVSTLDYFRKHYPATPQGKMREVLAAYVQTQIQGESNDEAK